MCILDSNFVIRIILNDCMIKKSVVVSAVFALLLFVSSVGCKSRKDTSNWTFEQVDSAINAQSAWLEEDYRPETGTAVYEDDDVLAGAKESMVEVKVPSDSADQVLIVKENGSIVHNAYIRAGDIDRVYLPNGKYNIFFYAGEQWDPSITICERKGAFKRGEFCRLNESVHLYNESVSYDLRYNDFGTYYLVYCDEEDALD